MQRQHRYYPKFPGFYSCCINSLIITAQNTRLKTKVWNKLPFSFLIREVWYTFLLLPNPFPPFWSIIFNQGNLFHLPWSSLCLCAISWFHEISWKSGTSVNRLIYSPWRPQCWGEVVGSLHPRHPPPPPLLPPSSSSFLFLLLLLVFFDGFCLEYWLASISRSLSPSESCSRITVICLVSWWQRDIN